MVGVPGAEPKRLMVDAETVTDRGNQVVMGGLAQRALQGLVVHGGVGPDRSSGAELVIQADHRLEDTHHLIAAALVLISMMSRSLKTMAPIRSPSPGGQRGGFRSDHRLHGAPGTEKHVLELIDQQQHRPIPFFDVDADVGFPGARGGLPVHITDVVARDIAAQLLEVVAATTQARGVPAMQHTVQGLTRQKAEPLGLELQPDQCIQVGIDPRITLWLAAPRSDPRVYCIGSVHPVSGP